MARYVLSRDFNSGFALDLMVKDLKTAAELVGAIGNEPSVSATAVNAWITAQEFLDDPQADHTAVVKWVEGTSSVLLDDKS